MGKIRRLDPLLNDRRASKVSRIRRRTCVTLIFSVSTILATDPARCSSSNRCR